MEQLAPEEVYPSSPPCSPHYPSSFMDVQQNQQQQPSMDDHDDNPEDPSTHAPVFSSEFVSNFVQDNDRAEQLKKEDPLYHEQTYTTNDQQQLQQTEQLKEERKEQQKEEHAQLKLTDFRLLRTLGTGSFGRVHLIQSKHNGRYYAMKVLKKMDIVRLKQVAHTKNERDVLIHVSHPFIVNLWGTFQDDVNLYMVMDYVPGGELFSYLRKSKVSFFLRSYQNGVTPILLCFIIISWQSTLPPPKTSD